MIKPDQVTIHFIRENYAQMAGNHSLEILVRQIEFLESCLEHAQKNLMIIASDRVEAGKNLGPINSFACQELAREALNGPRQ